jgi:predicted nuclease of predicted toxin-antitoxin system
MKLLLDENLSPRLVARLADLFPGSRHVREVGLLGRGDGAIWSYAATNGFTIVSKDDDFHHLSFLLGAPPKIACLRLGNCTTARVEALLRSRHADLLRFSADPEAGLILLP